MKFTLIRELDDGQPVFVSEHDSRREAERQAQDLRDLWPGVYVVREGRRPVHFDSAPPERHARPCVREFRRKGPPES